MNEEIYEELQRVARGRGLTTYGAIARLGDLDLVNPAHRKEMAKILADICTYEQSQGRPMLSAVVVRKDTSLPGTGFFKLARQLGLHGEGDDLDFFRQELERVYAVWQEMA